MNRDNRYQIMIQVRQFLSTINEQCNLLSELLEAAENTENGKLQNLPCAFSEGEIAGQIEEAIEGLQEARENLNEIQSLAEAIPDVLNLQMRKPRKKENLGEDITGFGMLPGSDEKRTERLQLVVTPTLATNLKATASSLNLSANEVVNRILLQALSKKS